MVIALTSSYIFLSLIRFSGHSSHVTNVRWSYDDSLLASVGGGDTSLMIWRRLSGGKGRRRRSQEDDDVRIEEVEGEEEMEEE